MSSLTRYFFFFHLLFISLSLRLISLLLSSFITPLSSLLSPFRPHVPSHQSMHCSQLLARVHLLFFALPFSLFFLSFWALQHHWHLRGSANRWGERIFSPAFFFSLAPLDPHISPAYKLIAATMNFFTYLFSSLFSSLYFSLSRYRPSPLQLQPRFS